MTKSTKAIILDIDGPLISTRAAFLGNQSFLHSRFDPCAVGMLNNLLAESNASIVISSSWGLKGKEICSILFDANGIDSRLFHDHWITPRKLTSSRSNEIRWWLDEHPEVSNYVVFDDEHLDSEMLPGFVQCNTQDGISFRNYLEARIHLGLPVSEEDIDAIEYMKKQQVWDIARRGDSNQYILWECTDRFFAKDK